MWESETKAKDGRLEIGHLSFTTKPFFYSLYFRIVYEGMSDASAKGFPYWRPPSRRDAPGSGLSAHLYISTVVSLTPLLLKKSLQTQILIPLAASLACGLLTATVAENALPYRQRPEHE